MNLEKGIEKIEALIAKFRGVETTPKAELKFESAKLNDGTTQIEWEGDLAVGTIVYVLDSNGAKLPLPAGQYQLEDGSTFEIVDDMGTADKVVKAGEAAPEAAAPVAPEEVEQAAAPVVPAAAPKRVIKSQVEEHVFSIELENEIIEVDLSSMFKKVTEENEALKAELEKEKSLNKEMFEVVKQIADEPASIPTEKQKSVSPKEAKKEISAAFKKFLK